MIMHKGEKLQLIKMERDKALVCNIFGIIYKIRIENL